MKSLTQRAQSQTCGLLRKERKVGKRERKEDKEERKRETKNNLCELCVFPLRPRTCGSMRFLLGFSECINSRAMRQRVTL
jgi:hypothetical protein